MLEPRSFHTPYPNMELDMMHRITPLQACAVGMLLTSFTLAGCADETTQPELAPTEISLHQGEDHGPDEDHSALGTPIFDIAALPNGGIVYAAFDQLRELTPRGEVKTILTVPTAEGSAVNGVAPIGARSFWITSAGLDKAIGAGLWRVSNGSARLVGDVEAFEIQYDPDATVGTGWKVPECEEDPVGGFSAGPQSNPYHLESFGGDVAVLADAAGNTVLRGFAGGGIETVAVLEPPTDENGDWHILKFLADDTECYVQPVPTAVAADGMGSLYVTELTGVPGPEMDGIAGESRIWRVDQDAVNASCPSSEECELAGNGFSSLIDADFGPDGRLYVVEYAEDGWFSALFVPGGFTFGSIFACDVSAGTVVHRSECETIANDLVLPGAITFDKRDQLWVVENHIGEEPSIHAVEMH